MAKAKRKIDTDNRQMSLLDLLQQTQEENADSEGRMNIHGRLCRSLSRAISKKNLSRWEISGQMSHLLGVEITKASIDAWTSESKTKHRIPAEFLPAFCEVTGSLEPLEILAEITGMFALPGPDVLRAEIQKLDEEEKKLKAKKKRHVMFLKEMEG